MKLIDLMIVSLDLINLIMHVKEPNFAFPNGKGWKTAANGIIVYVCHKLSCKMLQPQQRKRWLESAARPKLFVTTCNELAQ